MRTPSWLKKAVWSFTILCEIIHTCKFTPLFRTLHVYILLEQFNVKYRYKFWQCGGLAVSHYSNFRLLCTLKTTSLIR